MTSRRYRQTNSAQALKETNRFTCLNADPCSYARVSRRDDYVSFDTTIFRVRVRIRVRAQGSDESYGGGVRLGIGIGLVNRVEGYSHGDFRADSGKRVMVRHYHVWAEGYGTVLPRLGRDLEGRDGRSICMGGSLYMSMLLALTPPQYAWEDHYT